MMTLKKPIILIGAARSGTTILGEVLSKHQDIAYWVEPKYIWKVGKPDTGNDVRFSNEATPKRIRYIHKTFFNFLKKQGKGRFLEKTPSNCFRIPFIDKVFPDAIYINIIRDGRDVSLSAFDKWTTKHDTSAYKRRLSIKEIPPFDLPFYAFEFLNLFVGQKFWPNKLKKWGPMTPSISKMTSKSIEEACAFQWSESTTKSLKDLSEIEGDRVLTIRYEDFITNTNSVLDKVLMHCDLPQSPAVYDFAQGKIKSSNSKKWQKPQNEDFITKVNNILEPLLKELKYQ